MVTQDELKIYLGEAAPPAAVACCVLNAQAMGDELLQPAGQNANRWLETINGETDHAAAGLGCDR